MIYDFYITGLEGGVLIETVTQYEHFLFLLSEKLSDTNLNFAEIVDSFSNLYCEAEISYLLSLFVKDKKVRKRQEVYELII